MTETIPYRTPIQIWKFLDRIIPNDVVYAMVIWGETRNQNSCRLAFCNRILHLRKGAKCHRRHHYHHHYHYHHYHLHGLRCINSTSPIATGCFISVNINLVTVHIDISNFVMSGGILIKIFVLGNNAMVSCLFTEVLKCLFLIFDLQDQYF